MHFPTLKTHYASSCSGTLYMRVIIACMYRTTAIVVGCLVERIVQYVCMCVLWRWQESQMSPFGERGGVQQV